MCPCIVLKVALTLWSRGRLSGKGCLPKENPRSRCWSGEAVDAPFVRRPQARTWEEGRGMSAFASQETGFVWKCHGLAELLGGRASKAELVALFFLPLFHILSLKKQLRGAEGSVACKFGSSYLPFPK